MFLSCRQLGKAGQFCASCICSQMVSGQSPMWIPPFHTRSGVHDAPCMPLSKVKPIGRCELCKKDIHGGTGLHKSGCENLSISCWNTCQLDICKCSRVRFMLSNTKCSVAPRKALLPSWNYSMLLHEFMADGLIQLFCI